MTCLSGEGDSCSFLDFGGAALRPRLLRASSLPSDLPATHAEIRQLTSKILSTYGISDLIYLAY